jgi:outer membrane protein assembly factor BamE (lipoprotein component of BamABCDE complex)
MAMRAMAMAGVVVSAVALAGCAGQELTHGYVISQNAIDQISVGSSREQVLLVLGSPSTTSTVGGETFYYISQRTSQSLAFMPARVVDQRVLAVYFDDKGAVKEIGNFGLQDGKVFDFISRTTRTGGQDLSLLGQLLRAAPSLGGR